MATEEGTAAVKKKRIQLFLKSYVDRWPCLRQSKFPNHAFCTVCDTNFDISHQGAADCRRHVEGVKHKKMATATGSVPKINTMFLSAQDLRTIRAETLFTTYLVEHNLPLAVADHAGPLFRKMFPDSEICKQYGCGRTKTSNIVKTLALDDEQSIAQAMKTSPFSIATDGSTDFEDIKMYPVVVRLFDPDVCKVVVLLLKIVQSQESTGQAIFNVLNDELKKRGIPWSNCISFAADNAAVMQGLGKGVAAFIKAQHPHVYLVGCAYHLMHIAAERASRELTINIEDHLITIFYYLEKSSKRKATLQNIQKMCDAEVKKILKLSSTRWLSLGQCINRLLEQWDPLTTFFAGEANSSKPNLKPSFSSTTGPVHKQPKPSSSSTTRPVPKQPKPSSSSTTRPVPKQPKPSSSSTTRPVPKQPKPSSSSSTRPVPKQPKPSSSSTTGIVHKRPISSSSSTTGPVTKQPKPSSSSTTKPAVPPKASSISAQTPTSDMKGFDLTAFIFRQSEVEKQQKVAKEKEFQQENRQEQSEREMTKPQKVHRFLTDPMSKVYVLFLKRAVPIFDTANQALQKEEPCIHTLLSTLEHQLQLILLCLCKPQHIVAIMEKIRAGSKPQDHNKRENQLSDEELGIGNETKSLIESQANLQHGQFYKDVRQFFSSAADYMVKKFPFGDEVLVNAAVADISKRQMVMYSSLLFFIKRFACLLPEQITEDQLEDEFRLYQITDFEDSTLNKRIDEAWREIGMMKIGGKEVFANLSVVMLGILVIFHSNADCERVFSLVTKNKTQYRSSLGTDMVSSLVTRKVMMSAKDQVCFKETFSDTLLRKAKSATYEAQHKSRQASAAASSASTS